MLISAFEHWGEVVIFDDEFSLAGSSPNFTNVIYSSSSPKMEGSTGSKFLASQRLGGFEYAQSTASSPDIISSIYSIGGTSGLDDYTLHAIDTMDLRYDHTLNFPGQVTNSLICDSEPIAQAFCDEDHLQFFDTDLQPQNISMESPADLQSAVNGFMRTTAVGSGAQKRWKMLASVLKWFFIMVNQKRTNAGKIQRF